VYRQNIVANRCLKSAIVALAFLSGSAHAEDFFFDSAGVRIHYIVEGKGEPVVLVHGFGANITVNWGKPGIIQALAGSYQVIAMDNRGCRCGSPVVCTCPICAGSP